MKLVREIIVNISSIQKFSILFIPICSEIPGIYANIILKKNQFEIFRSRCSFGKVTSKFSYQMVWFPKYIIHNIYLRLHAHCFVFVSTSSQVHKYFSVHHLFWFLHFSNSESKQILDTSIQLGIQFRRLALKSPPLQAEVWGGSR